MRPFVDRAQRVTLHIPIKYRAAGESEWHEGRVLNISETGVLFGPERTSPPGDTIEVIFSTPVQLGSMAPGKMICVGARVRTTDHGEVGAKFEECRFLLEE